MPCSREAVQVPERDGHPCVGDGALRRGPAPRADMGWCRALPSLSADPGGYLWVSGAEVTGLSPPERVSWGWRSKAAPVGDTGDRQT